jgi:hypothetical protein
MLISVTAKKIKNNPEYVGFFHQRICMGIFKASDFSSEELEIIFNPHYHCKTLFMKSLHHFVKSYPDILTSLKPPQKIIKMKVDL